MAHQKKCTDFIVAVLGNPLMASDIPQESFPHIQQLINAIAAEAVVDNTLGGFMDIRPQLKLDIVQLVQQQAGVMGSLSTPEEVQQSVYGFMVALRTYANSKPREIPWIMPNMLVAQKAFENRARLLQVKEKGSKLAGVKCEKCHGTEMHFASAQLRCADESADVVVQCANTSCAAIRKL